MDYKFTVQLPGKSEKYANVRSKAEEKKLSSKKEELEKVWQTETRLLKTSRDRFVVDRRQSMGNVYDSSAEGSPQQYLRSKTKRHESEPEILDIYRKQAARRETLRQSGKAVNADVMQRLEAKYQKALARSRSGKNADDYSETEDEESYAQGDAEQGPGKKLIKSETFVIESAPGNGDVTATNAPLNPKPETRAKLKPDRSKEQRGRNGVDRENAAEREAAVGRRGTEDRTTDKERGKQVISVQHRPTRLEQIQSDRGRSFSDGDVAAGLLHVKSRLQHLNSPRKAYDARDDEGTAAPPKIPNLRLNLGSDSDAEEQLPRPPPQSPADASVFSPPFEKDVRRHDGGDAKQSPLLNRRSIADEAFGSSYDGGPDSPRPKFKQADAAFASPKPTRRKDDAQFVYQPSDVVAGSPKLTRRKDDAPFSYQPSDVVAGSPKLTRRRDDGQFVYQPSDVAAGSPKPTRRRDDGQFVYQPSDVAAGSPKPTRRRDDGQFVYQPSDVAAGSPKPTRRRDDGQFVYQPSDVAAGSPMLTRRRDDGQFAYQQCDVVAGGSPKLTRRKENAPFQPIQNDRALGSPTMTRRMDDAQFVYQQSDVGPASPNLTRRAMSLQNPDTDLGSPRAVQWQRDGREREREKPKPIYQQGNTSPYSSPKTTRRKREIVFTPVAVPEPNDDVPASSRVPQRRRPVIEAPPRIFYQQIDPRMTPPPQNDSVTSENRGSVTERPRRPLRRSRSEDMDLQAILAYGETDFPEIPKLQRRGSDSESFGGPETSRKPPKPWGSLMYELAMNVEEREEVARAKRKELVSSLRQRQMELDIDVSRRIQAFLERYEEQ